MRLLSRIVPWLATCAGVLLVGAACSGESLLTEADASNAPLLGNKTVEVILRSSDMVRWRDTTYQGYAIPEDVPFQLVVNESDLEARALARFPTIPGTFELDTLSFTVDSFKNASFRLVIDTIRSTVDSMSYTVEAYALDQSFDGPTATWTQASLGVPWITPGGTLGQLLGSADVTVGDTLQPADTVFIPIRDINVDSLLTAWRSNGGEEGVAFLVSAANELRLANISIRMRATLVEKDTTVTFFRSPSPSTFIYNPAQPGVGLPLRVAGLPANRYYFDFVLPDTFDGILLRGSTINLAELYFEPLPSPPSPFPLENAIAGRAFTLLADPFRFGPGTPIGLSIAELVFVPDSLAAGVPVTFPVTLFIQEWANSLPGLEPTLRFGVKAQPDGITIQFWEFGSAESRRNQQPQLRMLVTPPSRFVLP